jgi:hypothetical protein
MMMFNSWNLTSLWRRPLHVLCKAVHVADVMQHADAAGCLGSAQLGMLCLGQLPAGCCMHTMLERKVLPLSSIQLPQFMIDLCCACHCLVVLCYILQTPHCVQVEVETLRFQYQELQDSCSQVQTSTVHTAQQQQQQWREVELRAGGARSGR